MKLSYFHSRFDHCLDMVDKQHGLLADSSCIYVFTLSCFFGQPIGDFS